VYIAGLKVSSYRKRVGKKATKRKQQFRGSFSRRNCFATHVRYSHRRRHHHHHHHHHVQEELGLIPVPCMFDV
jgi:hypothetical protein